MGTSLIRPDPDRCRSDGTSLMSCTIRRCEIFFLQLGAFFSFGPLFVLMVTSLRGFALPLLLVSPGPSCGSGVKAPEGAGRKIRKFGCSLELETKSQVANFPWDEIFPRDNFFPWDTFFSLVRT